MCNAYTGGAKISAMEMEIGNDGWLDDLRIDTVLLRRFLPSIYRRCELALF